MTIILGTLNKALYEPATCMIQPETQEEEEVIWNSEEEVAGAA